MMNTKCDLSVSFFSVKCSFLFGTGELFRQSFWAPIDVKQYENHFGIMDEQIIKDGDHYQTPLPLQNPDMIVPNNQRTVKRA